MIVASNIDKTPLFYRRSIINSPYRKFIHMLKSYWFFAFFPVPFVPFTLSCLKVLRTITEKICSCHDVGL
jgi:hypothetical protein